MAYENFLFFIALAGVLLISWLGRWISSRSKFAGLPRVGIDPGFLGLRTRAAKDEFFAKGQQLLEHGYAKNKDTPYVIHTCDNERLVIPDRFIEELKNLPETQLSFKEELLDRFMGKYTKLDAVRGTNIHRDIVRFQLTKSLGNLLPHMKEEAELSLKNGLNNCGFEDFTPIKASSLLLAAIGQITSRRVIDDPLICRDPIWLKTIIGFTASVATFCITMRNISPTLRPIARYTLPCGRKLRSDIAEVTKFLTPVIVSRQRQNMDDKSAVRENEQPQDFVQWLSESTNGKGDDPEAIIMKILFLIVAAIYTSAITAIHALYDLCAHPNLVEELREEAIKELGANGWTQASLLKLGKMESFLKESGRTNSAGIVSFQRLVLSPIPLSNGFIIPKGTHICAASDARSRDPSFYVSPLEFRPMRFYSSPTTKIESFGEVHATNLFTSVAAGDSWFGSGRQACPGRWYASAQIKLVLCLLLTEYDFKFPNGQTERPKNWVKDEKTGPNMEQMILFRRRKAESGNVV
ncbi:cytochrome P450 [Aaosphaeria arxii CBS 175.79]|uniref:Cytochrome P450 n=1 Tax=Aaosphaeria arxii CBS 175.79 TaxID=1450172 RepID=A0A6A5XS29_9PLEO|nr:cytochrome P450 [Aaosphaeria arxii CBS 175.79]KAF2015074.1 cytochrome P450 [Aaosphaeria arxii CBS 175.79]